MKTIYVITLAAITLGLGAGCSSSSRTQRSAALGAATGAVVGGVIGHQSGEAGAGAAIGAAVGGAAGGMYGRNQERALGSDTSENYYLSLMTADEMDILRARARASGRSNYELADLLTEEEKSNLRRREASQSEIGR